jgi:hypothetical protein
MPEVPTKRQTIEPYPKIEHAKLAEVRFSDDTYENKKPASNQGEQNHEFQRYHVATNTNRQNTGLTA